MKIVIIKGSPHKKGSSNLLAEQFARGAQEAGHTIVEMDAAHMNMEKWMKELGLVMNITELGANEEMLEDLAQSTIVLTGGYKALNHDEIVDIFRNSL